MSLFGGVLWFWLFWPFFKLDLTFPREYADATLKGFAVRVAAAGTVTYTFRYLDTTGKPKRVTIGRWPELNLATPARRRRRSLHRALLHGTSRRKRHVTCSFG